MQRYVGRRPSSSAPICTRAPSGTLSGALPDLPLTSDRLDLVLCSHLLFTWADQLGEDWRRRALDELIRVARREVRSSRSSCRDQ